MSTARIYGGIGVWLMDIKCYNYDLEQKGGGWLTWDISVCEGGCGQGSSSEVIGLAPRTSLPHTLGNKREYTWCLFRVL